MVVFRPQTDRGVLTQHQTHSADVSCHTSTETATAVTLVNLEKINCLYLQKRHAHSPGKHNPNFVNSDAEFHKRFHGRCRSAGFKYYINVVCHSFHAQTLWFLAHDTTNLRFHNCATTLKTETSRFASFRKVHS